ncbi:MAG: hypothetical protein WBI29_02030 [Candidatus Saccharimonadales bacterium]
MSFETLLRGVVAMVTIFTFLWYSWELSVKHSRGHAFPRVALSFGSMFICIATLGYIVAPAIDDYLVEMFMEFFLVIGAVVFGLGVLSLPIVKLRQRRRDMQ